ncbi:type IV secretion protein Rhs [Burkholderia stabilis]|uniref:type VI secretion system Vgr family protein n=1 Tax=Burkholderia stabilis TaxID=95485 RepID=UPI000851C579|nr:type VI secretion system Vgr family protein [Burkholderia stabilis]AOR72131.1 type IV secretion protein Rhs [Burkholderia stabilis]HDR9488863.1 type VI secretion system tip protein VgrG [Burkholderia stabilis]HDR9521122.1 type VI secretion system tip protein VgrG [Burkholderia stabilis]HDR9528873.1 type VI secretion system tip protein VgrG [Burkholderia stabilis]HDR9536869.1 type VI secretion system tip protein VgrG [Burkholderia stabilis]
MTASTAISDTPARAGVNIHQFYSLDLKGAPAAALADIYEFEGTRGIGEPTKYTIQFTHPRHDLSRSEFLNRMGAFVIQPPLRDRWSQPEGARRVQGVVTSFVLKATNRDESLYEIVLESRLALLRNTPKCRFFLDMSIPEIIERILREHEFNRIFASFEFKLHRIYRKRSFVMQWGEDDLAFITRLCRRSGIWFVCEEGERCERVRFGDDYAHYRRDPERLTVAYRPHGGLEAGGIESVSALEMHAKTLPEAYTVRTFSTETAISDPIEAASPIHDDRTTYGEAYTWGPPNRSEDEAKEEAQLRREAALAGQVAYRGECDMLDLTPGSVLKLSNRAFPDAKHGLVVVRVMCGASRKKTYRVKFDAIPSDRQYRMPLMEEAWPRVDGVITGTIASSGGWKDPYLDSQGEYIVDLHLDRDTRAPGLQSCPMRLAKPFAGPNQTGFHFGLVEGTVVGVSFLWGCVDLPFISHVLHTAQHTDPIVAGVPWGTRNTIRTHSNNTVELDDRKGKEHIKVATEHGKTQLNLGYTVDREQQRRGEGFELRTDDRGHVRASGGLLVSSDRQEKAVGQMTYMRPATNQFALTQAQAQGLTDAAAVAQAEIADLRAENAWLKDELASLKTAVIALSAPNGIGLATPDRVMVSAGKDVSVGTSSRFNVNALRNVAIAAGEVLSLFAHKFGIKLYAARGKVQIQAQSDTMELVSQKDMRITSADGTTTVNAANGVVLGGGGTAYIKVQGDNVEIGGAGCLILKIIEIQKEGPGALSLPVPKFDQIDIANDERFILSDDITGRPVANRPYKIQLASGQIIEGITSDKGETSLSRQDVARGLKLLLQNNKEV